MNNPNDTTSAAPSAQLTIPIGNMNWAQVLPMLLAAIENGTPTGVRMAKTYLSQMATAADLGGRAVSALMCASSQGLKIDDDILSAIAEARLNNTGRGH